MTVDLALAVSALLMGGAGGPHCAAMCAPAQSGVARACGGPSPARNGLALQVGRVVGYAAAGAVLAGGVSLLSAWRETGAVLEPLWRLLHVAAFGFGVWLLSTGRQPAWLAAPRAAPLAPGNAAAQPIRFFARGPARAGAVGVLWVAMPCGLLQSALLTSALASTPLAGATVMTAFAVASAISLHAAPRLWLRWQRADRAGAGRDVAPFVRLAGLVLAAASGFALARDVGRSVGAAWCA